MQQKDLRREAALRIVETSRLLRLLVEQRLRPYGMTRAQYVTLAKLNDQDGLVQNELAEALEVQPIAMVRLVDQLSADGLVERHPDPDDRRRNRLMLTDAGRQRLGELSEFKQQLGAEVFEGIGEQELREVMHTLDRLRANIKSIQTAETAATRYRKAASS